MFFIGISVTNNFIALMRFEKIIYEMYRSTIDIHNLKKSGCFWKIKIIYLTIV